MWKLGIVGFESVSSITDKEDLTKSCKVYATYINLNLGEPVWCSNFDLLKAIVLLIYAKREGTMDALSPA
jgi:hypothetical protein